MLKISGILENASQYASHDVAYQWSLKKSVFPRTVLKFTSLQLTKSSAKLIIGGLVFLLVVGFSGGCVPQTFNSISVQMPVHQFILCVKRD